MCLQPTYGFSSKDALRFLKAANQSGLYYVEDPVLSLDQASHCIVVPYTLVYRFKAQGPSLPSGSY